MPAGLGGLKSGAGGAVYPAGTNPPDQQINNLQLNQSALSRLLGAQASTIGTEMSMARLAERLRRQREFEDPFSLLQMRQQMLERGNRVNPAFGPNQARRAYRGGL